MHLTSQTQLPFWGCFRYYSKRFRALHSFATFSVNHSSQNKKGNLVDVFIYWWVHLCYKLRTATKDSALYTHLLLSEWTILLNFEKKNISCQEFCGCVHLLMVSSLLQASKLQQNIPGSTHIYYFQRILHGTLVMKAHTLRIFSSKGYDQIKSCSRNCNNLSFQLCYTWYFKNLSY